MLAYSTVSQLGYMFLAVGSGAYVAAIFHMVTHAFFKALLFLGSGSVIHGMHDEQDMRRMGLLRKVMPITAGTFIVGWLAIAGVPPFAGFWSKDEILLFALDKSPALYVIGLFTALLTAYYMTRQVSWCSSARPAGRTTPSEHGAHGDFKPHESPPVMLAPLVVLAGLSLVGGIIQLPTVTWLPDSITSRLEHWLEPIIEFGEANIDGSWGYGNKTILMLIATDRRRARHRPRLPRVREGPDQGQRSRRSSLNAWYYDRTVSDFMGGPGARVVQAPRGSTSTSSTAPSTAPARSSQAPPASCARARAATCAATPAIIGIGVVAAARLVRRRAGDPLVEHASTAGFPILTALVLLPVAGALAIALTGKRRPSSSSSSPCSARVATAAMSVWMLAQFESGEDGLPVRLQALVDLVVGHLVAPRRRRHLAVPRRADGHPVPAGDPRHRPAPRREAVPRLAAAAARPA